MTEVRALRAYAEVALGRQRSPKHDSGPHMVPYLRAANVQDGLLDLSDVKSMNFDPKEQERFALRPGDVLVTEGSGSLSAVGASAVWQGEFSGVICFQNTVLRLRPRPSTDPRFLGWWCRYAFADGLFASVATGANIYHVSAERVRALPLAYLALPEQRAIADYLDTETARIDALITKKRRMIELLQERLTAEIDSLLWVGELVKLKHVAELLPGYAFPSANFDPDFKGARLLRGTNVGVGRIDWSDSVSLATDGTAYTRYRITPGDVVLGMDRPFIKSGTRVVVAGPAEEETLLVQRVCRIRPLNRTASVLIASAIRSPRFAAYIESDLTGVSVPHLSDEQIGEFRVPDSCGDENSELVQQLEAADTRFRQLSDRLTTQLDLLTEHRQALITAAVTGELEIPVAA